MHTTESRVGQTVTLNQAFLKFDDTAAPIRQVVNYTMKMSPRSRAVKMNNNPMSAPGEGERRNVMTQRKVIEVPKTQGSNEGIPYEQARYTASVLDSQETARKKI